MVLEILPHDAWETNEYEVILTCNFALWHKSTDAAMMYDIKAPDPGSVMMVADQLMSYRFQLFFWRKNISKSDVKTRL